jgi:glucan phosphoethanolaminetransferase (alkaline phosphatase superfamily)
MNRIVWCPEGSLQIVILIGWILLFFPGRNFFVRLLEKAPRGLITFITFIMAMLAFVIYVYGVIAIQVWLSNCSRPGFYN